MARKTIEAELRSILNERAYKELAGFFAQHAELRGASYQETHYLRGKYDLRIQRNDAYAKVWLKKGTMHDEAREEIEVRCGTNDFPALEELFGILGFVPTIKWFRWRREYDWQGTTVCLDYSRGYGYMLELERMCALREKEQELARLRRQMARLGVRPATKEELDKKFAYYARHWQRLTAEDDKQNKQL